MSEDKKKDGLVATAQARLSSLASTISPSSRGDTTYSFPAFDSLPRVPDQPQGCLWGFYDKDGVKDELGCRSSRCVAWRRVVQCSA